jgi:hypothetical protein
MIRSLALTVSFCLAGAASALAQTHPPDHAHGRPHGAGGHHPLDPSMHAAMHVLLLGSWTGTASSAEAVSRKLALAVASDKRGKVTLKMKADQPMRVGASTGIAVEGDTVHWTQVVSGEPCKVSAVVSTATPVAPDTMKGRMACETREITFALQKTKG